MKHKLFTLFFLLAFATVRADLIPQTLTLTWTRGDVTAFASTNTLLAGVTYRLTNCVAYTTATNAPQDLSSLAIMLRAGDNKTNVTWYGLATVASNGTFTADIQFPRWTAGPNFSNTRTMGIELTLIDTNGVGVTYNARKLYNIALPLIGTNAATIMPIVPTVGSLTFTSGATNWTMRVGVVNGTNSIYFVSGTTTNFVPLQIP